MAKPPRRSTSGRSSCMPGMVDLHVHLPQLPNAGVGAGLDLLTWLERYIFPLERALRRGGGRAPRPARVPRLRRRRDDDRGDVRRRVRAVARRRVPGRRGARHPRGHRQGDDGSRQLRRHADVRPASSTPASASRPTCAPAGTCATTAGCGTRSRRGSPSRAGRTCCASRRTSRRETGAYWQTHLSEDRDEIGEVARLFPDAIDYLDVYDRAGGLGPRTILAHAIHLSTARDRPPRRDRRGRRALPGLEPVPRLGRDAAGALPGGRDPGRASARTCRRGPELSIFANMRAGAYIQSGLRVLADERGEPGDDATPLRPARLAAAGARSTARGRSGSRTRSGRSRPARRPT